MTEEIIPTNGTSAEDVAYAKKVKEIYIDGANVAGCEFYYEGECCQTNYKNEIFTKRCKCSDKLCYYKQLKRLEQELDELKKACEKCKLFDIEKTNRDLLERVDKLEQENKELKEETLQWKQIKDMANNNEYRSALEEIREIADDTFKICDDDCENAIKIKLIMDKTNEALK